MMKSEFYHDKKTNSQCLPGHPTVLYYVRLALVTEGEDCSIFSEILFNKSDVKRH